MSFAYLALKRLRGGRMQLGLKSAARKEFQPLVLCMWLQAMVNQYRNAVIPVELEPVAECFLQEHEAAIEQYKAGLSPAGALLLASILLACEMPTTHDLDECLVLIDLAAAHAASLSARPIPKLPFQFSTRKHPSSPRERLMSIKGDVVGSLGFEAACLVSSAIKSALARNLGVTITLINGTAVFGGDYCRRRLTPGFADLQTWQLYRFMVQHLCERLELSQVKASIGVIKVLHDYFEALQTPETVYPNNVIH
ncbi:hypothetical protein DV532_26230 (plasmid) [Pseudomonas sp. Leaf58]|uniref:hypothetical protein n=1 Tax=Pseudomonas sp. Leaf58 TaxID=1736226 RepID=UPI0006F76056|nr:hypothetical protein [Pseudomonas sp. Leaf58]AYG47786.1 hypothetical protein DV532_26230 [Pseudomonas sp. Leaf58]KQN62649.1 hypothetical protein ASF02_10910 [Pseudomonas sp. Leaf58]